MNKIVLMTLGWLLMVLGTTDSLAQSTAEELRDACLRYYKGLDGTKVNYDKALRYAIMAGEKGNGQCCMIAGNMYIDGRGTDINYKEAAKWFQRAGNYPGAEANLGYVYLYGGYGVTQNLSKAFSYFQRAAKRGDAGGQKWLGYAYQYGYGTEKNLELARQWYQKAVANGDKEAPNLLAKLGGSEKTTPAKKTGPKATIKWLTADNRTSQKRYTLKAGIKSDSEISNVTITVNGQADRGIKTVEDDGYDITINRELTLAQGLNRIRITVTNGGGTTWEEKEVTYYAENTQNQQQAYTDNSLAEKIKAKERRVALVIGNGYYEDSNMRLNNPVNDAADMASKLVKLGFVVVRSLNQSKKGMEDAVNLFSRKAKNCDVALFYYAGHGIQYQGSNYMVPVDAKLPSEEYVQYNCTNADLVLDVMEKAGSKMKIAILDACRNNPFARSWHRSAGRGGLATMNAPKGTFIAYSTAPGDVAIDGVPGQRNSPYTAALLKTLDKKGLSITDFFQEVLEKVATTTNEKQNPWTSNSFRGKFVFNPQ